ncbi:MAG: aminomethyl transferase family protein, partial [Pseudorhodoplanes sp.]
YTTPYELGYNTFTKFDHDFIGSDALKAMEGKNKRKKVTFAWNNDDVNRINASMFAPHGENFKFIDLPLSNYASSSYDTVTAKGGKMAGASMFSGYSFNERKMLSLGWVEEEFAKPGTELTLVWGEENGGTKKTTVERHKQTEVKVVVGPTPYAAEVREGYEGKWRHQAA